VLKALSTPASSAVLRQTNAELLKHVTSHITGWLLLQPAVTDNACCSVLSLSDAKLGITVVGSALQVRQLSTLSLTKRWPSALVDSMTWSTMPDYMLRRLVDTSFLVQVCIYILTDVCACTLEVSAGSASHPQLDKALALSVGGQHDLVHHARLAVAQAGRDILLSEALRHTRLLLRQRRRLQAFLVLAPL